MDHQLVPSAPALSAARKASLLAVFAASVFIDVLSASAFFVLQSDVARDLNIPFTQQSWVITSYTVTFASFLLFWGRFCDLHSSRHVFVHGLMALAVLNLATSFLTSFYAFFVFRAFLGIAAASLVPSAYRLIAFVFRDNEKERTRAYTIYGMTGSIANVTGTIIAGVVGLIREGGQQMQAYRWFFRIVAVACILVTVIAYLLLPHDRDGETKPKSPWRDALWLLDPVGLVLMLLAVILLILGLTLGASNGWATPSFLVPFLLSFTLFPAFFYYETRIPPSHALIPPSIWRIPNVTVLLVFALISLGWWGVFFVATIQVLRDVEGESLILAAVRVLPTGVSAGLVSVGLVMFPSLIRRPKIPIIIAMLLCIVAYTLWTQAPSLVGMNYWKYIFPGMLIGSGGMQVVLISSNVGVMLAAPPDKVGVVGAALQTSMQTSTVLALSIQAGLFEVYEGSISNPTNVRLSWYFELGWTVLWLIGFVALYRPGKEEPVDVLADTKEEI